MANETTLRLFNNNTIEESITFTDVLNTLLSTMGTTKDKIKKFINIHRESGPLSVNLYISCIFTHAISSEKHVLLPIYSQSEIITNELFIDEMFNKINKQFHECVFLNRGKYALKRDITEDYGALYYFDRVSLIDLYVEEFKLNYYSSHTENEESDF